MRLLMATNNAHKLREVSALLATTGVQILPLADFPEIPEPPEDQDSFEGNALQKARFVFERTGLPCVADDSGLEVDALGLAPGVRSKRWSQEGTDAANNARLARELEGVVERGARYRCAVAVVCAAGEATASGSCEGRIGHAPRGSGGFGYDPWFWPVDTPGRTMAQLSLEEKNRISHRARAVAQLPGLLRTLGLLDPFPAP